MNPIRAHIDLDALRANVARLREAAPASRFTAIVKANAYGHGAVVVARALEDRVDSFAVARLTEALELLDSGIRLPIVLLEGACSEAEWVLAQRAGFESVVHRAGQIDWIERTPPSNGSVLWVKVNTGMNRLGFRENECVAVWRRLRAAVGGQVELRLLTHLACADEPSHPMSLEQLACFARVKEQITRLDGGCAPITSIGNSAGALTEPGARSDWVRPGIALYGVSPLTEWTGAPLGLKPVMRLEAQIISLQALQVGETVGYGASWRAQVRSRIAIVAAGYADGVPRNLSPGTPLVVRAASGALRPLPLAGRVSMDMLTLDVTTASDVQIGDVVELWGGAMPVESLATAAGTLAYELLCRVPSRVPRIYGVGDQKSRAIADELS